MPSSPIRTALVALPWAMARRPSAALGALKGYVQRERPLDHVECVYAYLDTAVRCGKVYDHISENETNWGTLFWGSLLYPENAERLRKLWCSTMPAPEALFGKERGTPDEYSIVFGRIRTALDQCLEDIVASRDWNGWVVGLTTGFAQIFGDIELARRIKRVAPDAVIVLGGSSANGAVGHGIVREYDWIDYVIQGEGERPLKALLDGLAEDWRSPELGPATICRRNLETRVSMAQISDLDALPVPDYDEYFRNPRVREFKTALPIEGSRGCWWDRTAKDPKSICAFCNLNSQWVGYRQKTAHKLAQEVRELCNEHHVTNIAFTDNIVRHRGFDELIRELNDLEADLSFFYEARAHLDPSHILAMWEVGLRGVQFGIEALSTSLLQRIGKGTTAIQNLQAIKTACELEITHVGNMIVGFPGSTQAEVDETLAVLELVVDVYEPLLISEFVLGVDSYVHREPDEFGVSNVRNSEWYGTVVPDDVLTRLALPTYSFDLAQGATDWTPVVKRLQGWKRKRALTYVEGPDFVRITDQRRARAGCWQLDGWVGDLYIYSTQIRHRRDILSMFEDEADADEIEEVLHGFLEAGIMFSESNRFLSLAVASDPERAARRIRRLAALERPVPKRTRLMILDEPKAQACSASQ